jgi:hypothetical protein
MYGQKVILPSSDVFQADPKFKKLEAQGPKACSAMSSGLRCYLDNIHVELGSDHIHLNEDGTLTRFKNTSAKAELGE